MKNQLKAYFNFSKKERYGILSLLVIIVVLYLVPVYYYPEFKPYEISDADKQKIDAIFNDSGKQVTATAANTIVEYFSFNPNNTDSLDWLRLGLTPKNAHTILNYTRRGGKFYKPEDFKKIWGIKPEIIEKLLPYIVIENNNPNYKSTFSKENLDNVVLDINVAAAEDWRKIKALVYPLPYKIVNYRERLGGFIKKEQLKEVSGMNDTIYTAIEKKLLLQTTAIKKININTATEEELSIHPYISYQIAKAIVLYRTQKGKYLSVEGIKKIVFIKDEVFNKIAPYCTVE